MSVKKSDEFVKEQISKKASVKQKSSVSTMIYAGPNIPGVVSNGMTFCHGIPKPIEEIGKEMPLLNDFFLPVLQASKAMADIRSRKGVWHKKYVAAENLIKSKGENNE